MGDKDVEKEKSIPSEWLDDDDDDDDEGLSLLITWNYKTVC